MSEDAAGAPLRNHSRWLKPWAIAVAVALASGLGVLNFTAALSAETSPWIKALDLVADLAVLAAGISVAIYLAMSAEADSARMQQTLAEVEARLAAILDSAMDAIVAVDEDQRVVLFNRAAEQVFRCPRHEALGGSLDRFIPARFRAAHHEHVGRFAHSGATSRRMGEMSTLWGLRADGEEFPIEASISQTQVGGKRYLTAILRDVTRRKEFEDALKQQQQELRELSARVIEAREDEKTLIARELHDELGQLLTALKMDLSWLRERIPEERAELSAKAQQMNAMLDQTVASVRRISADLRPLMLDDLGLADAAQWLVEDFGRRSGIECRLDLDAEADLDAVERAGATAVYRALQESLTNIARHAGAKHAWVMLGVNGGQVELEIEDDGRGIAPDEIAKSRSLGLKGMRERIHYLGGQLEIARAPRGGTRVRVRLPAPIPRQEAAS